MLCSHRYYVDGNGLSYALFDSLYFIVSYDVLYLSDI